MDREGLIHSGFTITTGDDLLRIDVEELTGGKSVMIYGQTEITADLYNARDKMGAQISHKVKEVMLHGLETKMPFVTFKTGDKEQTVECDFVVGCDGFHGSSRQAIPKAVRVEYERVYPFGWLGVLSDTTPAAGELIYASHDRGFALCSMRSPTRSRYYIQCNATTDAAQWSDVKFWDELAARLPPQISAILQTGKSIEKSVAPLRSYVCETMRYGRLFLAGDAAHIVPPTGAKGLNLAASDIWFLHRALHGYYRTRNETSLSEHAEKALRRIWKTERFSWWMTSLLHRFPNLPAFEKRMHNAELDALFDSKALQTVLAENYYVGLPYE